jgi:hypothetical protein
VYWSSDRTYWISSSTNRNVGRTGGIRSLDLDFTISLQLLPLSAVFSMRRHHRHKFPFSPHKLHPPPFQFLSPLRQPKPLRFHWKSPFFPPPGRSTLVLTYCNSMHTTRVKSASLTRLRERLSRSGLHRQYNSRTLLEKETSSHRIRELHVEVQVT